MELYAQLNDPLKSFKIVQKILAIICLSIPLILRWIDTDKCYPPILTYSPQTCVWSIDPKTKPEHINFDHLGFRQSISDYTYGTRVHVFALLYTIAAMMYIFNGAIYFKNEGKLRISSWAKWINFIIGISLLGVVCAPQRSSPCWHLGFAISFFFFNGVAIVLSRTSTNRKTRLLMVLVMFSFFGLPSLNCNITYLWAEWLALFIIVWYLWQDSRIITNKYEIQ